MADKPTTSTASGNADTNDIDDRPPALNTRSAAKADHARREETLTTPVPVHQPRQANATVDDTTTDDNEGAGTLFQRYGILLKVMLTSPMGAPPSPHAWHWRLIMDIASHAIGPDPVLKEVGMLEIGACYLLFGGRRSGGLLFSEAHDVCDRLTGPIMWAGRPAELTATPRLVDAVMRKHLRDAARKANALDSVESKRKEQVIDTGAVIRTNVRMAPPPFTFTQLTPDECETDASGASTSAVSHLSCVSLPYSAEWRGGRRKKEPRRRPRHARPDAGGSDPGSSDSSDPSSEERPRDKRDRRANRNNSNNRARQKKSVKKYRNATEDGSVYETDTDTEVDTVTGAKKEKKHGGRVKLSKFQGDDVKGKDNVCYRAWRAGVKMYQRKGYRDRDILPEVWSTVSGQPAELLYDLGDSATVDAILELLDGHYGNVLTRDGLISELYAMRQTYEETVTAYGVRLVNTIGELQSEFPKEMPPKKAKQVVVERLYGGLRSEFQGPLSYLMDDPRLTYEKLIKEARRLEKAHKRRHSTQDRSHKGTTPRYSTDSSYKNRSTINAHIGAMVQPAEDTEPVKSDGSDTETNATAGFKLQGMEGLEEIPFNLQSMAAVINEMQRQQGNNAGPPLCYGCGDPTHLWRDCPKNPRNQKSGNGKEAATKPNRPPQKKTQTANQQ